MLDLGVDGVGFGSPLMFASHTLFANVLPMDVMTATSSNLQRDLRAMHGTAFL